MKISVFFRNLLGIALSLLCSFGSYANSTIGEDVQFRQLIWCGAAMTVLAEYDGDKATPYLAGAFIQHARYRFYSSEGKPTKVNLLMNLS